MNVFYPRLKSMLPPRTAAARGSCVADPKVLRDWLDHLPLANRGFALLRVHDALREFNATAMAPQPRLAMLDMFETTAHALVDDVKNEVREFFPMSAERIDDAQLAAEIECELAIGYTEVVCDLCSPSGRAPFLRRGVVAKSLTRACLHQSARLWQAFRTHTEPGEGVWQGLHDLFRFAVKSGCADKANEASQGGAKTTARSIYIQAVLHAFAKPNQFTQTQNRQLHSSLPVLASWCTMKPGYAPTGAIAVCATGDLSPPAPPRTGQIDPADRWVLDIHLLLARFDALLVGKDSGAEIVLPARRGGGRATLAVDVVEVLCRVWSERTARESQRNTEATLLETEVGLSGLHFILSGSQEFESALPLAGETQQPAASWAQRTPGREPAKRARAEVVDRSRRGYRLRWSSGEEARARVGELIAFAPLVHGERQWHYGALRWLRADARAGVEAGVELLPSGPIAVAVYALDMSGIPRVPVRGILVNSSEADAKSGAGILVPRPFARDAVALEVLRTDEAATEAMARPVRVARFSVQDDGLYQKIVLPDEALERIRAIA